MPPRPDGVGTKGTGTSPFFVCSVPRPTPSLTSVHGPARARQSVLRVAATRERRKRTRARLRARNLRCRPVRASPATTGTGSQIAVRRDYEEGAEASPSTGVNVHSRHPVPPGPAVRETELQSGRDGHYRCPDGHAANPRVQRCNELQPNAACVDTPVRPPYARHVAAQVNALRLPLDLAEAARRQAGGVRTGDARRARRA